MKVYSFFLLKYLYRVKKKKRKSLKSDCLSFSFLLCKTGIMRIIIVLLIYRITYRVIVMKTFGNSHRGLRMVTGTHI